MHDTMTICSMQRKLVQFNNILKFRDDQPTFTKIIAENCRQTDKLPTIGF